MHRKSNSSKRSDDQLTFANPIDLYAVEKYDVSISLWGDDNTKALSGIDPQKQALAVRDAARC